MQHEIQSVFQEIGNALLDLVGDAAQKVLAYVEAEEGVVSVSVFYTVDSHTRPIYKNGNRELSRQFYSLWQNWSNTSANIAWRSAHYFIEHDKPILQVVYPDKFIEEQDEFERRDVVVLQYFGRNDIDYANPD
jgi:hypothetical protein